MWRCLSTAFLIVIVAATSSFAIDAPYGLTWGKTLKDVKVAGVTCSKETIEGRTTTCKTTTVPKPLPFGESYFLLFDSKYGLQKIVMVSTDIKNDIFGIHGMERYNTLKAQLTSKYASPAKSYESIGETVWTKPDEFYQCLRYEGCGQQVSYFMFGDDSAIALELKGLERGVGYLQLDYEGPKWATAIDERQATAETQTLDAL